MKIFYAVQATGNGHISRAMELLPYLQQYGNVDIFLSGSNASLQANLPVTYRDKGLSLYYAANGVLDILKTARNLDLAHVYNSAKQLPLEKYDLIINDFESICSIACQLKKLPSVHFGHQASFASSKTPRPQHKNISGEFILKNFAKGSVNVGLHFQPYDDFILPPVVKTEIWNANPKVGDYVTVYLPSFSDQEILQYLKKVPEQKFEIFSKEVTVITKEANCTLIPVGKDSFNQSLINCDGILSNAGFETPAEAMYLNKKIFTIPIGGQYEQECNAAAMQLLGAQTIPKIESNFVPIIENWLDAPRPNYDKTFSSSTEVIVEKMMKMAKENGAVISR